MSWECHCAATPPGRGHRTPIQVCCPYCGRRREHVEEVLALESKLAEAMHTASLRAQSPAESDLDRLYQELAESRSKAAPSPPREPSPQENLAALKAYHPTWITEGDPAVYQLVSQEMHGEDGWIALRLADDPYTVVRNVRLADFLTTYTPH